MKKLLIIGLLCFIAIPANAQNSSLNLAIPQSPQSYQSDRVRAGDLECSSAIGSSTNVEFGVVGILDQQDPYGLYNQQFIGTPNAQPFPRNDGFLKDVGVYAKITIPIGAPKERLNCNTLYKLELEKKRIEVLKLQKELEQLRNLKFEE